MDQIREHITHALDQRGVLSRLKAELRANVFLAINDQDISQGGTGLGSKSDATRRQQLATEPSGALLLELVREFMAWCNLQFTQQVYEQEVQLGRALSLQGLQQQLGLSSVETEAPLLLQLLKQHMATGSAPAEQATASTMLVSTEATAHLPEAPGNLHSTHPPLPQQQQQQTPQHPNDTSVNEQAGSSPAQTFTAPGNSVAAVAVGSGAVLKGAGKHPALALGDEASIAEDSGLIGTQMDEHEEQEYATMLLPKHHNYSGTSAQDDDDASSTSSTDPVCPLRPVPRSARVLSDAAAAAAPSTPRVQQPALSLPMDQVVSEPSQTHTQAQQQVPSVLQGGAAGALADLSDSFGHDRSLADSSFELQGFDSPRYTPQPDYTPGVVDDKASQGGSNSSSRTASSSEGDSQAGSIPAPGRAGAVASKSQDVQESAGSPSPPLLLGLDNLPTLRAPGRLAPLPLVRPDGNSAAALNQRTSDLLRGELLASGLLQAGSPVEMKAAVSETHSPLPPPVAGDSDDSYANSSSSSPATTSNDTATEMHAPNHANLGSPAEVDAQVRHSTTEAQLPRAFDKEEEDEEEGSDSDSESSDVMGQQALLQAARRQLSTHSSRSAGSQHKHGKSQQEPLPAGPGPVAAHMQIDVSGASLGITCSDLDGESISEDLSLPIEDLSEDSETSSIFQPMQQSASQGVQTWGVSARPQTALPAAAAAAAAEGVQGSRALQHAQAVMELPESSEDEEPRLPTAGADIALSDDDF